MLSWSYYYIWFCIFLEHCTYWTFLWGNYPWIGYPRKGSFDELYPDYRLLWISVCHRTGLLPQRKLRRRHYPLLFYILPRVFFSLRRIVMRARRHVIINANTQFLLYAFHSVFRERENRSRKRKSNVGREHWRKRS